MQLQFYNGSYPGLLRALKEGKFELAANQLWLSKILLDSFDSTDSYIGESIMFSIPPSRELNAYVKLFYPFSAPVWILILLCFLVGFAVISALKCFSLKFQNFVFGSDVKHPNFNMIRLHPFIASELFSTF